MIKPKYIFLTLSLIALAIGFSNVGQNVFVYLGLPVGAILFGLFMIFQVLENESALFDEQQYNAQRLPRPRNVRRQTVSISKEAAHTPVSHHGSFALKLAGEDNDQGARQARPFSL